jgi:hypothetical protein
MQKLILPFFVVLSLLATPFISNAQCADGELTVEIIVNTDNWAGELYWELVPSGQLCGEGEVLLSGGNVNVGCDFDGGGATAGPEYWNNDSFISDMTCATSGTQLDLIHVDDYGDGGTDFIVLVDGVQTQFLDGSGYGETFVIDVNNDGLIDHDSPCDALEVEVDGSSNLISSVGATASYFEVSPPALGCNVPGGWCEGDANVSVWAKFTVLEEIRYQIRLCNENTNFDSQIAAWVSDECGVWDSFTLVGANDDAYCGAGAYYASTCYTPCLPVGTEVYVQIDGWYGATGIGELTVGPSDVEPSLVSNVSNISCALETEFNPDGAISIYSYNDGLGAEAFWTGPFGYTGTGTSINNLLPGVYNVEMISSCPGDPYTASFEIINPEPLELNVVVNSSCESGSGGGVDLTISGGTGDMDIDWDGPEDYDFDGEDLASVESGMYNVEVSDSEGCYATVDVEVPFVGISPFSLGDDLEMCSGDMNFFFGPIGDYNYEWQDGSTGQLYILQTQEGQPTTAVIGVSVTNDYGCELSDAIVVTVVNCVGTDDLNGMDQWSIAPNPLNSSATLRLDGVEQNSMCVVRDIRGKIVSSEMATDMMVWDASKLESGIYVVEVVNSNGAIVWNSRAIIQ